MNRLVELLDKWIAHLQDARTSLKAAGVVSDEFKQELDSLLSTTGAAPRQSAWKRRKKDGVV